MRVHSSLDEARACTPLAAGGALVGTAGGLVRLDATGGIAQVWTASDGLPGTRIESISDAEHGELWIGTDNGVAKLDATGQKILLAQRGRSIRDVVTFAGTTYLATWSGGVRKLGAPGASDSTAVPLAAGKWSGHAHGTVEAYVWSMLAKAWGCPDGVAVGARFAHELAKAHGVKLR